MISTLGIWFNLVPNLIFLIKNQPNLCDFFSLKNTKIVNIYSLHSIPIQFQCKQLTAVMTLGYKTEDFEGSRLVHMRNATIPIGCACVMDATLVRLEALIQHFVEKRSKTTKKEDSPEFKPMKRHPSMKKGGLVRDRRQHKMGQMADSPPLRASSIFDLYKHDTPQIKSQTMRHTLMNSVNTTFIEKYGDP